MKLGDLKFFKFKKLKSENELELIEKTLNNVKLNNFILMIKWGEINYIVHSKWHYNIHIFHYGGNSMASHISYHSIEETLYFSLIPSGNYEELNEENKIKLINFISDEFNIKINKVI